ncbi:MAG: thioredoxin family protein [Odoribacteraceae bacterium]|jgi:thiol-disulfide isomerase/thioredoxin|nr:thioredoxin family protein [Odoribacteraceae bacterium]
MKQLFFTLALALSGLAAGAQGVEFQPLAMEAALVKAKAENKHIFIDCYTAWCGPCKLMDKEIFPLAPVGEYFAPRFIALKYDMEKDPDGLALGARFGVKAYPTFIILDPDGEMRHIFAGGILSLAFIDKVAEAFDDNKALGALQRRVDAGNADTKTRLRHVQALAGTHTADVTPLVDQFYDAATDEEKICAEALFVFADHAPLGSPRAEFLVAHRDEFRQVAGADPVDDVLKRKYIDRYTRLLRGDARATAAELDELDNAIHSLGLANAEVFVLYREAMNIKAGTGDTTALLRDVHACAPRLKATELDMFIYSLLTAAKSPWNKDAAYLHAWSREDTDALLLLVSTDMSRDYIRGQLK